MGSNREKSNIAIPIIGKITFFKGYQKYFRITLLQSTILIWQQNIFLILVVSILFLPREREREKERERDREIHTVLAYKRERDI